MPPEQVSHYRLVERLGAGAYGEVWRGVHVHDPALQAAVKLIHAALANDPAFVASLKAECRLLARLNHPHIVGFRDLILSAEHPPAMVLELVDGGSLEDTLARGPSPPAEVLATLGALLSGLEHAHGEGVVHRDIKPGNVLIDGRGRVRLVDFGLARAADSGQATRTGLIQGTLDYIAPEVFLGQKAGPAADVYAVGLVAWELLAGRRACPDGPLGAKLGWHMNVGPADLRALRPDCPAGLAELVATFTARDPAQRPADGRAAAALLSAAQRAAPTPPRAAPSPAPPRAPAPSTVRLDRDSLPPAAATPGPGTVAVPRPASGPPPQAKPSGAHGPAQPYLPKPAPPAPAAPPANATDQPSSSGGLGWWTLGLLGLLGAGVVLMMWRSNADLEAQAEATAAAEKAEATAAAEKAAAEKAGAERVAAEKAAREERLSTYALKPVPAGTYTIGCTAGQGSECQSDEKKREVTLTRGILVGTTEVTQGLWARTPGVREAPWLGNQLFDGKDSGPCKAAGVGEELPVTCVSWAEAAAFANALSKRDGLEPCYLVDGDTVSWPKGPACLGYRLPTESEWEVAARGNADLRYAGGADVCAVANVANASRLEEYRKMGFKPDDWKTETCDDGAAGLARVGSYPANGYGLHDMSGNVWEWTWDWYSTTPSSGKDPTGLASGSIRVLRGGSWDNPARNARVAFRNFIPPGTRYSSLGFRLLRTAP